MSIRVMSAVWDMAMDSSAQKLVLLALADNANDAGECFPSMATIARKTSLDERTVRRAVRQLEELKFLSVAERVGRSSMFSINLTTLKNATPINDTPSKNERGQSAPPPLPFLSGTHPKNDPPPLPKMSPTPDIVPPITITNRQVTLSEEPSEEPTTQRRVVDLQARQTGITAEAAMAIPLREAGMNVTSMHPTLCAWVRDGFTTDQVLEALKLAQRSKGTEQGINANYVDAILRNPGKAAANGSTAPRSSTRPPIRMFPTNVKPQS